MPGNGGGGQRPGRGSPELLPQASLSRSDPPVSLARTQSTDVEAEIPPSLWVAGIKDGVGSQAGAGVGEDAGDRAHIPGQHRLPEGQGGSRGRARDDGSRACLRALGGPSAGLLHQPGTEGMSVTRGLALLPALFWGPAHGGSVGAWGKGAGGSGRRGRGERQR